MPQNRKLAPCRSGYGRGQRHWPCHLPGFGRKRHEHCRQLCRQRCRCRGNSRSLPRPWRAGCHAAGGRAQPEACQKLVEDTVAAFGRIDVLVNNAGITADKLLLRMTEADFDNVLATNLKGAFFCTKAACRFMMHQRYGRIISVSSVVGLHGNAGQANYAASKAGLIGLTKKRCQRVCCPQYHRQRCGSRFYCNRYDRRAVRTGPYRSTSGHPGRQNRPCRGCCGGGGFSGRGAGRVYYRAGPLR